jgi:hypothetical protein
VVAVQGRDVDRSEVPRMYELAAEAVQDMQVEHDTSSRKERLRMLTAGPNTVLAVAAEGQIVRANGLAGLALVVTEVRLKVSLCSAGTDVATAKEGEAVEVMEVSYRCEPVVEEEAEGGSTQRVAIASA